MFNILRSFLALFAGRRRKGITRSDAASVTEATATATNSAATEAPAATAIGATPVTIDAAAATTDAAATATKATAADTERTGKPQERKVMSSGFDMQAEIAKLAERIIEPVAAKLTEQDLEHVVGQIRRTFEQLDAKRTAADSSLENLAVNILEPIQPSLTDAERRRAIDRLSGAMAAFCHAPGQRAA